MNRVEIEIDGTPYTFPINPVSYEHRGSYEYSNEPTIDSQSIRFKPLFDSRKRIMKWRKLPNRSVYLTMITTLRSAIGASTVRLNHRDLDIAGDQDLWMAIRVEDVDVRLLSGAGPLDATSHLSYNIDFTFTLATPERRV